MKYIGNTVVWSRFLILLWAFSLWSSNAASFEELAARAAAAREANQLPEAVKLYREALNLNPKWQEGLWFLGTILYDTNEFAGCRNALSRLVQLKTDAAPAWGILGLCEFQTAAYEPALAHIEHSLTLTPPPPAELEKVLRFHEAILLTHARQYDKAVQKFVWFLRAPDPSNVLLTALGLAALRTPMLPAQVPADQQDLFVTAGLAAFAQMTGNRAATQQNFETLLARYPTAHHVHYLYACSLLVANPDQAIREFRRELENTPDSSGTLAMLAWADLNRGEAREALGYAQKAAASDPGYPLAQYVLGRALVETGDTQHGIPKLELTLKSDPENLETHLALAAAYPKVHRYEDARRERRKCLELTKDAPAPFQP